MQNLFHIHYVITMYEVNLKSNIYAEKFYKQW